MALSDQEAKIEAERQSSDLWGEQAQKRTKHHFGLFVVSLSGWVLVAIVIGPQKIDMKFFVAAATILPVMLFALLVRIGESRRDIAEIGSEVDQTARQKQRIADDTLPQLEEIRQEIKGMKEVPDEVRAKLKEVEAELDIALAPDPHHSGVRLHRMSEHDFVDLNFALMIGVTAIIAVLVALASNRSAVPTFALTAAGIGWTMTEIIRFEVGSFGFRSWKRKQT